MLIIKMCISPHFLWEIHEEMEYSESMHVISKEIIEKDNAYH